MNRVAVWVIYAYFWWTLHDKDDQFVYRYSRRYWATVDSLIKFGLAATLVFIVIVVAFAVDDTCGFFGCETRFASVLDAPANEMGDTLAGLAGGLAFLWIIVTVMLQSKELAAQRQELRLTRRESAKMAAALEAQAKIFEDEQQARKEERTRKVLYKLVEQSADMIERLPFRDLYWEAKLTNPVVDDQRAAAILRVSRETSDPVELVKSFNLSCVDACKDIFSSFDLDTIETSAEYDEKYSDILSVYRQIEELKPDLSQAECIQLEILHFDAAMMAFSDLLSEDSLWNNRP